MEKCNIIRMLHSTSKKTEAIIQDTDKDAIKHISRVLGVNLLKYDTNWDTMLLHTDKLIMNSEYHGNTVCDDRDDFNVNTGKGVATKKAKANHNKAFKKALIRWQVAMIKTIIKASPDTFEVALHKVRPCKCNCHK